MTRRTGSSPGYAVAMAVLVLSLIVSAPAGSSASVSGAEPSMRPSAATAPAPALDPALDPTLDRTLQAVAEAGMPGALARVERSGTARWRGAAGEADLRNGRPMRPHMRFRIGSITKTFVATVMLQLAGEGRLDLDDPVSKHLPGVLPDDLADAIDLTMLLNHTSGLPDYDTVLYTEIADLERYRLHRFTPRELVDLALTVEPGPPGGPWSYANTNYVLLGMVVEKVTGRSIQREVTDRIVRPLRLRDTSFPRLSPLIPPPHPRAYVPAGTPEDPLVDFTVYTPTVFGAAGAIISTSADLERFFDALLTGELLPPEQLAAMQETVPAGPGVGYGLGLLRIDICEPFWGHDGIAWGHQSISLSNADATRQVTFAATMTHYAAGDNPLDRAIGAFMTEATCPSAPSAADRTRSTPPFPDLTRLPDHLTNDPFVRTYRTNDSFVK